MRESRWISMRSYALAMAVALSPAFIQTEYGCERGDTYLLSLELEIDGVDRIVGFTTGERSYAVTTPFDSATLRAVSRDPNSRVTWQWMVGGTSHEVGELGQGGGEAVLTIPEGVSRLNVAVRAPEGVVDYYRVDMDHLTVVTYPCTEQGVVDAAATGGAALVDCATPTTITTTNTISISNDLILMGDGNLTVDGNDTHRVFLIGAGPTVELMDLGVTGGNAGSSASGGGILNHADLTLTRCTVTANTAGSGGGIQNSGTLTLRQTTISGNTIGTGGGGGGVASNGTTLRIEDSTISGNTAGSGGGVFQQSGTTLVTGSTISGNTAAPFAGGGIHNLGFETSTLVVRNSTISGNSATTHGDAIYAADQAGAASLTLFNATVADNTGSASASAIYDSGTLGTLELETSIITGACVITDLTPTSQYTLESPGDTCGLAGGTGNLTGVSAAALDLGPLQNNGGPTNTHAPGSGSIAIDGIPSNQCLHDDQRGIGRPQGTDCDYGAVETTPPGAVFACTEQGVRDAVAAGTGPYQFDCGVPTTVLTHAEIEIDRDVILDGEGLLTLDGRDDHRVLSVGAGVIAELRGMTIQGGSTAEFEGGGGILSWGDLTLDSVTVSNNHAISGRGGGIANGGPNATLNDCVVSYNTAQAFGGGIENGALSTLTLIDSLISENEAFDFGGGGIHSTGTLALITSEVSDNRATDMGGGGIAANGVTINGSLIARNDAGVGGGVYATDAVAANSVFTENTSSNAGAGLYVSGNTTLTASTVSLNDTLGEGGGIYGDGGALTLDQGTLVSENSAAGSGGGVRIGGGSLLVDASYVDQNVAGTFGGGAAVTSLAPVTAELRNGSSASNNTAENGGGLHAGGATELTIRDSAVSGNAATGEGGGIRNFESSTVVLEGATVSDNTAATLGGGIHNLGALSMSGSTVSGNQTTVDLGDHGGAGLFNGSTGLASIDASSFTGNASAADGGGIMNEGDLSVIRSSVSGNTAREGAGFFGWVLQTAVLADSTVNGNTAATNGGGLSIRGGVETSLTNVTVSENSSGNWGGGLLAFGTTTIWNSTFAGNTVAHFGSAIHGNVAQMGGTVLLGTVSSGGQQQTCDGSTAVVVSAGYNIESPEDTCALNASTDQTGVTASALNLGPLADNGGPTLTHAPNAPSAAIDQIPEVECVDGSGSPLTADQRGAPRPWGPTCDVGSVEVCGPGCLFNDCPEVLDIEANPTFPAWGEDIALLGTATDPEDDPIAYRWSATAGTFDSVDQPAATYTCTESGPQTITLEVSDDGFATCAAQMTVEIGCPDPPAVECPCFTEALIEYERASFAHPDAYCIDEDGGDRLLGRLGPPGGPYTRTTEIAAYYRVHPADSGRRAYCYGQLCRPDGSCYTYSGWENPPYGHLNPLTVEEWQACDALVQAEIALHGTGCN